MPFIACLNNVKTTHTPHPQSQAEHGKNSQKHKNYTLHNQPTPNKTHWETRSVAKDARVHYADLKQQPHQHPHPHTPKNTRAHTRAQAKGGPEQPHHTTPRRNTSRVTTPRHTADSSGPNSVLILPNPCLPKHKACETRRPDVSTIPLVNTTIRARTFAWRRGMCSLERR